jgi:ABC-type Fe3+-siderophore transport system permease subunit
MSTIADARRHEATADAAKATHAFGQLWSPDRLALAGAALGVVLSSAITLLLYLP